MSLDDQEELFGERVYATIVQLLNSFIRCDNTIIATGRKRAILREPRYSENRATRKKRVQLETFERVGAVYEQANEYS